MGMAEFLDVHQKTRLRALDDGHDVSVLRAPRRRRARKGYLELSCCRTAVVVCGGNGGFLIGGTLIFVSGALLYEG